MAKSLSQTELLVQNYYLLQSRVYYLSGSQYSYYGLEVHSVPAASRYHFEGMFSWTQSTQLHWTGTYMYSDSWRESILLTLGAHAQRGLQYSFCLSAVSQSVSQSVSVSVHDYSRTAGNEAASERYQQLQRNKRSKIKKAILLKRRRSRSRNWHYRGPRCVTQPIN